MPLGRAMMLEQHDVCFAKILRGVMGVCRVVNFYNEPKEYNGFVDRPRENVEALFFHHYFFFDASLVNDQKLLLHRVISASTQLQHCRKEQNHGL